MAAPKSPRPAYITVDWIERHCVTPDGDNIGDPFLLPDEQASFTLNHYTVSEKAKPGQRGEAFLFSVSQLVRPQKWGKSPLVAGMVCLEAVGPALFAGWPSKGDAYRCSDHGCSCGWVYYYAADEPAMRPWPTPLIQITATSEAQTGNVYDALRPMISEGPLSAQIPRVGEDIIRLPRYGEISPVTTKANSRLGQRVTFVPMDETGIWTAANGMVKTAITQRRGLAGMRGRSMQTTNAWDPSQDSVAQQTYESSVTNINRDYRLPPADLKWTNKAHRLKMLKFNYAGAPWAPIDEIVRLVDEMMETDPADAERFFGNRIVYGTGSWLPDGLWAKAYKGIAS